MATRHRLIVPPRALEKYRKWPSGDHVGLQSSAASSVTDTPSCAASEPLAATVQMSFCPLCPRSPQKAIRAPPGDQLGCSALMVVASGRICPELTLTTDSPVALLKRAVGSVNVPGATTISAPSGDQLGEYPKPVRRVTDSPEALIRNTPPPSRSDRNAMRSPSGENAGCRSSAGESGVKRTAFLPPMRSKYRSVSLPTVFA